MCTVSWRINAEGYEVLFNRDELRSREVALPPRRQRARLDEPGQGIEFLAPIDPQGGGTWMLVNALGLTLCLTNGYRRADAEGDTEWRSRGRLVLELAGCRDADEVSSGLESQVERHPYRSFSVLAFMPHQAPQGWRWGWQTDGSTASELEPFVPHAPLSSSSFDATGAESLRRGLFAALPADPDSDDLLALHRAHDGGAGPLTPCMHRPQARTVSLTRVEVDAHSVQIAYAPGPPCRTPLGPALTLDRSRA